MQPRDQQSLEFANAAAEALAEAVRQALICHERASNPIAVWRSGRVEWIAASESLGRFDSRAPASRT